MKRFFLSLFLATPLLAAGVLNASEEVNMLQNGSFERFAVSGVPDAWTRVSGGTAGSERSNARARAGGYSLRINDNSATASIQVLSERMPITEGATYELSGYVYLVQATSQPSVYVRYYDANDVQIYNSSTGGGTAVGTWNFIRAEHRAPLGARYARLLCYSTVQSVGEMYFDGLVFRRAENRLVDNPDMALDAIGHHPSGWFRLDCLSERAAVEADPANPANNVLKLVDNSSTAPVGYYTSIPVIGNMTYEAGADILREAGTAPALYVKYYDENNAELSSNSVSTTTTGSWQRRTLTSRAPVNAVRADILAYISVPGTGVSYFDNISFVPKYEMRYVAPVAAGSGDGSSRQNAALFNNSAFWTAVNNRLVSSSIKVVFLEGNYVIDRVEDRLFFSSLGSSSHRLIIEGERPFGSVLTRTAAATADLVNMVSTRYSRNITFRNLHWEDGASNLTSVRTGYSLALQYQSSNIVVEGCSFVGLWRNYYGALGAHHDRTNNITVRRNEFVGGGMSAHFHMIYNSYKPSNLRTLDNYFQDARGSYVRHRAGCTDVLVRNNRFVSTAQAYNNTFVELAVFNDVNPGDEVLGTNFLFEGNTWHYRVSGGTRIAFGIHASGFDPTVDGVSWNYLLNTAQGNALRSGSLAAKKAVMANNFGLDFGNNIILRDNTRAGSHSSKGTLLVQSNYGSPNNGGSGTYNISDLVGD